MLPRIHGMEQRKMFLSSLAQLPAQFSWLIMTGYESDQAIVWIVCVRQFAGAPWLVSEFRSSLLALVIYPQ